MLKFPERTQNRAKLPRALSVRRKDFNLDLLGKFLIIFIFTGPILVPIFWLTGDAYYQNIAAVAWEFGRSFCTYTAKSFEIGGVPMMVCARCFGVASGLLVMGLLYHYTGWLKLRLPRRRLYTAALIGLMFVPWLIDSGLERLELWVTDYWLMYPTGMLAGASLVLVPLLAFPLAPADKLDADLDEDEFVARKAA
jgi:uncharacterized membrane protein